MKLIAFDQSTTKTGWCVMEYETAQIIDYGLFKPKGDTNYRIRQTVKEAMKLCRINKPTFVYIEGIQIQKNPKVYEILSKLQGTLEICLEEKGYIVNVIKAPEWRRRVGIKNKNRQEVKNEAIKLVNELYNLEASEDECEAILFARAFSEITA